MSNTLMKEAIIATTSHGLPRVVTANSRLMRVIWLVAFVLAVTAFVFHASLLVKKYNKFNLVTHSHLRSLRFQFPDVFICHNTPIAQSYTLLLLKNKSIPLQSLLQKSQYCTQRQKRIVENSGVNSTSPLTPDSHFFWETTYSKSMLDLISHRFYQTVVSIFVMETKELDVLKQVELSYDREHFYCFKLSISSKDMDFSSESVDLVLYSDDDEDVSYHDVLEAFNVKHPGHFGLKLFFTKPGTKPNLETRSVCIRPGYYYNIALEMTRMQLQTTPRRPCYTENITFISPLFPDHYINRSDPYEICIDTTIQRLLINYCGCFDMWLTYGMILPEIKENYPSCFNISDNRIEDSLLIERYRCYVLFTLTNYTLTANAECRDHIDCISQTYIPLWSLLPWPQERSLEKNLEKYIRPPYLKRKAHNLSVPGWWYLRNQRKVLNITERKQNLHFRNTISQVRIRGKEIFSTLQTVSLHYQWLTLISDLGGILGLYLGVSILTLFELVELAHNTVAALGYSFLQRWRQKRRNCNDCVSCGGKYQVNTYKLPPIYDVRSSKWI